MNESQDLIQEANIIPVINIESGTPLTERPEYSINFDHLKTSFGHEKHDKNDDDKSDKSSIFETSHKVFEKITGSLTALSKSLRNSLDLSGVEELEQINKFEYDIDIIETSPGNKFIATWSSQNGGLAVFPIDSNGGPSQSIFSVKTPFDIENVNNPNSKIYISVSEDGQYVAISRITVRKEHHTDTPNMDATANSNGSQQFDDPPESSFVVYSTKHSKRQEDSVLNSMEILGPLIFTPHHTLVCFTRNNMHLFSTKHWILRKSIRIDALIHSSPNYSNNSNEYLINIYDILIDSLKYGRLIWPEERDGISVWDTNGILRQWFYVDSRNISYSRNLFAISPKGDMVARFCEGKKDKSGFLCTYHTPTGLLVSEIEVPKSAFLISFLQNTDQIILCSKKDDDVRVQLWDCWAGLLVFEEKRTYLNHKKPLLLIENKFLQAVGNELNTYPLFPNNSPSVTMEALVRTSSGFKTGESGFVIMSTIEKQQGTNFCWGHILNKKEDLLCKFKFEPWHSWNNSEIFIHWLDSEGKRFIMAGKDSVQIYKTKPKGEKYIKIDLQYIWLSKTEEIKLVTLETRGENELSLLHVQLANNETVTLSLPGENEITYQVLVDACISIHYLRLQYMDDVQYFSRMVIRDQLKKLVESSIPHFPTAFNKIPLGNDEYFCPMEDFILFGWDDLVKKVTETDRYIPLFHNEEQTESALLLLVELQKSELVELMVNYIIKHVKRRYYPIRNRSSLLNFDNNNQKKVIQQPGFAWTLGKTLLDLYKYYPDKGVYIMRESSYFTTSLEAPRRILQTKLGNPFSGEERSHYSELKSVSRKARLPRGTRYYDGDNTKKRESGWIDFNFDFPFFVSQHYESTTRRDTGALVYYPEGTHYSDWKQNMYKETYGSRQRRRKQRLEDAKKTHPARLCVVPWPDFCVYPPLLEDRKSSSLLGKMFRFWNLYVSPIQRSPFADVALNGTSEMFSEVVMEAIVKFKWDKFAQRLFLCNFAVYLVHAIIFCTIVSVESDLVPTDKWKKPLLIIDLVIPIIFLIQELRQMSGRWKNYWSSFFNYFDLASFVLPLACIAMIIIGEEPPPGLKSFAVLCVWVNALLQARAFAGPGKFIAIVIEIGKKILTLFMTLLLIVLGFANALFVLLRDVSPMDIVQTYNGTITDQNTGQSIGQIQLSQTPQPNTNMWARFDYSILATYFFLGIGWDSVTTFNPDPALYTMMVLFSFVAVIMLLNILIGLITEVFSGSLLVGRQAWLRQRAELIAELELFMLSPSRRQHPDWFPHLIYYEAHLDAVNNWKRKLFMEEMGELDADFVRKELKNVRDDLHDELKELKGMVGHIRVSMRNPVDGSDIGNIPGRSSMISV